jgi:hypothetical protein
MVKHRNKHLDNLFKEQLHAISKVLENYHHVQVFDTHSDKDPNDQFNEIYTDKDVRILYNYIYDYIEILTDNLCVKGEVLHLFTEPDPEITDCSRIV